MFERIRTIKIWLIAVAVVIAIATLLTSNYLIRDLQHEERNRMEVWAEAMRSLNDADEFTDLNLVLKVINGNNTIPVIVLDRDGNVQTHRNIDRQFSADEDSITILRQMARRMKNSGNSLRIFPNMQGFDQPVGQQPTEFIEICYDESLMLKRLAVYPYVQLSVVVIFVLCSLPSSPSSRR